ncbi:MAG: DUF4276 family protein [Chitinophagales bacterium]
MEVGGLINYAKAKRDIQAWLKEDNKPECRFSTMFDLYALPNDFPKYQEAQNYSNPYDKVAFLEEAMKDDIDDHRFIPYIQLHEFESLILSNPSNLEFLYLEHESAIKALEEQLNAHNNNAELINERKETAPSKRIIKLIPEYDKVSAGSVITDLIGIHNLKANCKHFREWIEKLEQLSKK